MAGACGARGERRGHGRTSEGLVRSTGVADAGGDMELARYDVRATGHAAKLPRDLGLAG